METERLVLRPWADGDVEALATIFAEPAFWHFPCGRGFTHEEEETEQFLERQLEHCATHGFGVWAVELKAGGRLAGPAVWVRGARPRPDHRPRHAGERRLPAGGGQAGHGRGAADMGRCARGSVARVRDHQGGVGASG